MSQRNSNLENMLNQYKIGFLLILIPLLTNFLCYVYYIFIFNGYTSYNDLVNFLSFYKIFSLISLSILIYGIYIIYDSTKNFLKKGEWIIIVTKNLKNLPKDIL
jgi:hypothetical protein